MGEVVNCDHMPGFLLSHHALYLGDIVRDEPLAAELKAKSGPRIEDLLEKETSAPP